MSLNQNAMKKTPIYIQLLEFLEAHGISKSVNISDFMLERYGAIGKNDPNEPRRMQAETILSDLGNRKLIEIDNTLFQFSISGSKPSDPKWFDNATFNACLTSSGLEYLNQYRLIQSNLELNEASKRNSEIQKRHSKITILVAAVSALCSIFGLYHSYRQGKDDVQRIEKLEKEIIQIRNMQK